MKRLVYFLIILGIMYYVGKSSTFREALSGILSSGNPSEEKVTLGNDELAIALDENEQLAGEVTDLRKDLFSILVALNGITDDALSLERSRETGGNVNGQSITKQIHAKMDALRERLDDARQRAGKSEELQQEIDRIEKSIFEKEQEIRRLTTKISLVDDEIKEAVEELEVENQKLIENEADLRRVNREKTEAMRERLAVDQRAWIDAGNELVNAARAIPRPSSGKQGDAIVRAKLLLLRSAQEDCYNVAIRLNRGTYEAREANRLGNVAHDLFEKAAKRKNIGEDTTIYDDEYE